MTEPEWEACTDPRPMLDFLHGKVSDRKFRLFAVACCRQLDAFLYAPGRAPERPSVTVAERLADGRASEAQRHKAWKTEEKKWDRDGFRSCSYYVVVADSFEAAVQAALAAYSVYEEYEGPDAARRLLAGQCQLVREVFGNPFSPVAWQARWRTPAVQELAQLIYDGRRFDNMLTLWDALLDAGCMDAGIEAHCRGSAPHSRGCWCLDLCLAKE